jgi:sulfhydrogenase subunit beta (sulfur reductase)
MEIVFIGKLKPLLDAIAEEMELYIPEKSGEYYVYKKYNPLREVKFNEIRACTPAKEFLFPLREIAATLPGYKEPEKITPFAVFGLKDCDVKSIKILDRIFAEDEFQDGLYMSRRGKMFIISTDCGDPGQSCFCSVFDGEGFSSSGFDLNVSQIKDGFIIEAGSHKGKDFIKKHSNLFADVPSALLAEREKNRERTGQQLEKNCSELKFDGRLREIVEESNDSDVFDAEAKDCIECQACTRVCPTCHCFYLFDAKQKDYFVKMKMWDSCMRTAYAAVAGGANPRKVLGDRIKHRMMHKFVYFLDRYGISMCVGCGRCIDSDAGGMDLRQILKKLSEEYKQKDKGKTKVVK